MSVTGGLYVGRSKLSLEARRIVSFYVEETEGGPKDKVSVCGNTSKKF